MTLSLVFWLLMLIWLVFGLWSNWPVQNRPNLGGTVLLFILLLLLGWRVFGPPIHS